MTQLTTEVASLSPAQRALLEQRLKERSDASAKAARGDDSARNFDDENLVLAESNKVVEGLLSKFYGRFPWPWPAMKFDYLEDPAFETTMLNQDVGDWTHRTVPARASIWVGGCGTNQAINTALRFPQASVIGSDISSKSLELCAANARQLGITNLELREESINHVTYKEQFDHVICTGVIHHNADPQISLERLAAALKPDGIMEMIVYNRYHRTVTSGFQKAIRVFGENRGTVDFDSDFDIAKRIVDNFPAREVLERGFIQYMDFSESDFADLLIQPVEHSYTVESLEELGARCGLEFLYPCISLYVKSLSKIFWNLEFKNPELQSLYDALPDTRRWQVTNLLLQDQSPMLWFYLHPANRGTQRKTERQVCDEFLETVFERTDTSQRSFIRDAVGKYALSPHAVPYPLAPPDNSVREIVQRVDGKRTMRAILRELKSDATFQRVNQARIKLTTSAFPYLKAVQV
jgi:SAM-dependent methyltransferase